MKSIIILFIALISFNFSSAQISIELVGGLDHSFRALIENENSNQLVLESRKENEMPKLQHRFGINALVKILPSLQFKSGMRYAETGYIENTFDEPLIWGSGTVMDPYLTELYTDYVYLEVPLELRWSPLRESKVSPFLEAGVNPHFSLYRKTKQVYSDGTVEATKHTERETAQVRYHTVYYVAVGSLGAMVKLTDNLYLTAQATGRYHLTDLNLNDSPINERHRSIGGEIGVGYLLGKKKTN